MTKIKLCGLTGPEDIIMANELKPDYAGFVFAASSRRYLTPERAAGLKEMLDPSIKAVGVFVDESTDRVLELIDRGIIDMVQLHGSEDENYIIRLKRIVDNPVIRAFRIKSRDDVKEAEGCSADHILLDSGSGTGKVFDWELMKDMGRPCFLAGGLTPDNVGEAVRRLRPYAVDVSSGIETDGIKDHEKMRRFVSEVRKADQEQREAETDLGAVQGLFLKKRCERKED
ncbi:MAG: phosphoribosylanthranilate isomerase [Lachnospiraceae bacterium]|nr:phosphoribosylanthranilate isomerase [Lachnospiraceae bacterium]